MLGAVESNLQVLQVVGAKVFLKQQLRKADDGVHWGAYLMAHIGKELALGFICGFSFLLGLHRCFFCLLANCHFRF